MTSVKTELPVHRTNNPLSPPPKSPAVQIAAQSPGEAKAATDRQAFRELDRNADGQLSRLEMGVGALRTGFGIRGAWDAKDRLDTNGDRRTSFQEFSGTTTAQRIGAGLGETRTNLAGQLDLALPPGATESPHLRERVLDRAAKFEQQARDMARAQGDPNSPLGRLRGGLGENFAPDANIELHGIASHFGPETLQARVRDRAGAEHTFVRDGQGAWVERPDLQALHAAGRIPSSEPGMANGVIPTATYGVATVGANGRVDVRVPDVSNFSHQPRANPFNVGDTVQVIESTGNARVANAGQPYVADDRVSFGRIAGTDGRGNWTVELTNADGTVRTGADGKPETRTLTDAQLREANNPTVLRNGSTIYDATYDRNDPAQRRMIADFHRTPEAQELERTRPGPNASAAERAAWERRAIDVADTYLDRRIQYPMSETELGDLRTQRTTAQTQLAETDRQIAEARTRGDSTTALEAQRAQQQQSVRDLDAQIQPAERYYDMDRNGANIGAYAENGLGQCRHQAIGMQTLLQELGVDARMTRGAANTGAGNYRGEHMWIEATLSDGNHMLVDPTWSSTGDERPGSLETPYRGDLRRIESSGDTLGDYRRHLASLRARDGTRIDADERTGTIAVA
ncbi:MAG: hypothetical protein A2138_20630 [Deltaproteobacteria bacterium RBG_16_71_12]|nr:MAG: hypothetical protein A2138_20630 [Deltaproteobacteria bacterium RBG_16_71_12]